MFDDPENLLLYEACEKVGLPVMFHIDQNKNMVEPGMERVDRVLKMFPKCKIVAHAYWWRQLETAPATASSRNTRTSTPTCRAPWSSKCSTATANTPASS